MLLATTSHYSGRMLLKVIERTPDIASPTVNAPAGLTGSSSAPRQRFFRESLSQSCNACFDYGKSIDRLFTKLCKALQSSFKFTILDLQLIQHPKEFLIHARQRSNRLSDVRHSLLDQFDRFGCSLETLLDLFNVLAVVVLPRDQPLDRGVQLLEVFPELLRQVAVEVLDNLLEDASIRALDPSSLTLAANSSRTSMVRFVASA